MTAMNWINIIMMKFYQLTIWILGNIKVASLKLLSRVLRWYYNYKFGDQDSKQCSMRSLNLSGALGGNINIVSRLV